MLSEELSTALNEQMNFEFLSAHYYLAMSAYFKAEDLDGFAHFFWVQAEEERFHAEKFFTFINEKGGRVKVEEISQPQNDFDSIVKVFQTALEHEKEVTSRIYELMDLAREKKEYSTISFLDWFVDEQVEEEATMEEILNRLERLDEDSHGIFMLDNELSQRVFNRPQDVNPV